MMNSEKLCNFCMYNVNSIQIISVPLKSGPVKY